MNRIALPGLVAQLLQDGKSLARAEVALFKARLTTRLSAARTALILLAAAAVVALVSLIGLVVGLVMALATLVGPAFAGLIVLLAGLVIAGVLGWLGARQLTTRAEPAVKPHPALENRR